MTPSSSAEVAEWQTQRTQNAPWATTCGFKSRPRLHTQRRAFTIRVDPVFRPNCGTLELLSRNNRESIIARLTVWTDGKFTTRFFQVIPLFEQRISKDGTQRPAESGPPASSTIALPL